MAKPGSSKSKAQEADPTRSKPTDMDNSKTAKKRKSTDTDNSKTVKKRKSTGSHDNGTVQRRKSADSNLTTSSQKHAKKPYPHIKPQTKRVPQETITTQWRRLPDPAQRQVRSLFLTAKRSALSNIKDGRRRHEAEVAVNALVRRLEKQLPRMPFPPGTKKESFSLDEIVGKNRLLEQEEMPAIHSIELLKTEIEREDRRLEKRREMLAQLEVEENDGQPKEVPTHPLLEKSRANTRIMDDAECIGLVDRTIEELEFEFSDPDLEPLVAQLGSHLESIQKNGIQLEALGDALINAQAALHEIVPQ